MMYSITRMQVEGITLITTLVVISPLLPVIKKTNFTIQILGMLQPADRDRPRRFSLFSIIEKEGNVL